MRLKKGMAAPAFELQSIEGETVSLGDFSGSRVLLILNRFANCPFCSLSLVKIAHQSKKLEELGVKVVMVFPSPVERIKSSLPDLGLIHVSFLSDPELSVYQKYHAEATFKGCVKTLFDFRSVMQSMQYLSLQSFVVDGKISQLPCSFLVGETGKVVELKYGTDYSDIVGIEDVRNWVAQDSSITK